MRISHPDKSNPSTVHCIAFAILSWLLFNYRTDFIPSWGAWYSADISYQLQSAAFSQGHLYLLDSPQGITRDWAWHEGAHQVWGLGVPFIFYIFSAFNSFYPVPDRLLFSIAWILIVTLLAKSLNHRGHFISAAAAILPAVLSPFIAVASTRLAVYEQAVLWGALLSIGCIPFILYADKSNYSPRILFFVGLYVGFLPLVRPTLGAYWLAMTIIVIGNSANKRREALSCYVMGSAIGLLTLAITNVIRFGSIADFGHSYNVFGNELVMYVMKWPELHLSSLWLNFLDIVHAVFYYDGTLPFNINPLIPNARLDRFSEFYFLPFTPLECIIALCMPFFVRRSLTPDSRSLLTFGLISLPILFFYYLISHIFSSRYLIDFTACLYAMTFICIGIKDSFGLSTVLITIGALVWNMFHYTPSTLWYAAKRHALTSFLVSVHHPKAFKLYPTPGTELTCPINSTFYSDEKLLIELGWDIKKTCSTGLASGLIFKANQCISLRGDFRSPESFMAKAGKVPMTKIYQSGRRVTFCLDTTPSTTYEVYYLRFAPPTGNSSDNKLMSVRVHPFSNIID